MLIDVDSVDQAESHKWGRHILKKHIRHMFYIQFFKRNRLRLVSDMSEASKSCSSTSTPSTRRRPTNGYVIFKKKHIWHMFYIQFSREIDWELIQICQRPQSHAHRRRQRQPGRVPQSFAKVLRNSRKLLRKKNNTCLGFGF